MALFVYPDFGEVLAKEVAGRDVPALQLGGGRDDAVPPEQRHRVGLSQCMSLKIMYHLGALPGIRGHRLCDIERVEKTVGRSREIDRREIVRDVFGQLKGRVIVKIA